jgi:hypothetical protein
MEAATVMERIAATSGMLKNTRNHLAADER